MAAAAILKKTPYFGRGLTDVDKIWHSDAVRSFLSSPTVKSFKQLKNP